MVTLLAISCLFLHPAVTSKSNNSIHLKSRFCPADEYLLFVALFWYIVILKISVIATLNVSLERSCCCCCCCYILIVFLTTSDFSLPPLHGYIVQQLLVEPFPTAMKFVAWVSCSTKWK